jgi:hypothetical protein
MMGSKDDPQDGAAVAGTVFSAVIVYAVGAPSLSLTPLDFATNIAGEYCVV